MALEANAPRNGSYRRDLVVIAGVPVDNLDMASAAARIEGFMAAGRPHYVATANVNFIVTANRDPEFMEVVRMADMITADGMPLVWFSRRLGAPLVERVTGTDLVHALSALAADKGYRLFFLGGRPGVGQEAVKRLRLLHPALQAESFSPDFDPLLEMNNREILARVEDYAPHALFVSLGAGKAEKWMRMNLPRLRVPVSMGVGAAVDFVSGRRKRAPVWMQRRGLEWVHRFLQEPRRLGRRYSRDYFLFNYFTLRQLYAQRWGRIRSANVPAGRLCGMTISAGGAEALTVRGRLDMVNSAELARLGSIALESGKDLYVDLSRVTFMDSSGLGALVGLEKLARESGRKFRPAAPSGPVMTLIGQSRMQGFFSMADTLPAVGESRAAGSGPALSVDAVESARLLEISLSGRLDADVGDKLRSSLFELADRNPEVPALRLDMKGVIFIDSSGLAALIALHKKMHAKGRTMSVANLSGDPAKIFKIMNMEKYLDLS